MTISIEVEDEDYRILFKELKKLQGRAVEVGILGKEGSEILMIATVHEFGVDIKVTQKMRGYLASQGLYLKGTTKEIKIPERSYIRETADKKQAEIMDFISLQYDRLFQGKINAKQFRDGLGVFLKGITQKTMVALKKPPNHPFTLSRKAPKTNPLIDSGDLLSRIDFEVK